jgi:hypothetical protein
MWRWSLACYRPGTLASALGRLRPSVRADEVELMVSGFTFLDENHEQHWDGQGPNKRLLEKR